MNRILRALIVLTTLTGSTLPAHEALAVTATEAVHAVACSCPPNTNVSSCPVHGSDSVAEPVLRWLDVAAESGFVPGSNLGATAVSGSNVERSESSACDPFADEFNYGRVSGPSSGIGAGVKR